jgi:Fe2+ transport system protein FeoA
VAWSGVGRAVVGVWNERLNQQSAAPDANPAFDAVRTLLDRGVEVTISLDEAPADLSALIGLDTWDVPGLIGADESLWMPWSERMLDLFGQGVLTWQLGRFAWDNDAPRLAGRLGNAASAIARWVPGPQITAPWPIGYAMMPELVRPGRGLVLHDDGAGSDRDLDDTVTAWAGRALAVSASGPANAFSEDAPGLTIEFPASTDGRVSRAALGKLARRVITAWAAAHRAGVGDRVVFSLSEPWSATGGLRPARMPTPELAAWRTLSSVLGSPGVGGLSEIDLLPGVRILLSGTGDEGVLIAWLDDPEAPVRTLELPLTVGPVRRVDLLGSRQSLQPIEDPEMGLSTHRIALSREPIMIEGVRADLVRFLASVRLAPERLSPVLGAREHRLVINNPWPFPVRGRVFIVEPGGLSAGTGGRDRSWEVAPRVFPFSIDAGQEWSAPVEIAFGAGQETGWTDAVFDIQLSADEEYALLRVPRRVEIDSEDLELTAVAYRSAGAVSVHAIVTNRSDDARSVELAAVAAGAARERATVNALNKGQSAERRFLLFGLAPGTRISVGLTEPATGTRLTRTIEAP